MSRATVSKVEARLRRVTDAELYLFAKVLDVSLGELFEDEKLVMRSLRNP